jgi:DNA mismatch repair protein MutL
MSSRIALMPEDLANQIAAGEVVERPASVVKELVENALDAGAQRIDVDIEEGGVKLCRITDDGSGMGPEDAELCLLRHATSKLRCADDLFRLTTMGFRGEALASIAAVSRLTLTTRTRDAVAAYRITTEGGAKTSPSREVGGPVGTQLEVRDLFYNVPARLKFLKTEATETGHIAETLIRLSLSFPGVHFKLRHRGKVSLDLPPHKTGIERSAAALAARGKGAGVPTLHLGQASSGGVSIEAHVGAPDEATATPRNVFLLVNRRFVRDRSLLHAVQAGYGELLEKGRYPLLVLHVEVSPNAVDVNVHPQKLEVRMQDGDRVYSLVRQAVQKVCVQSPWLLGAQQARRYVVGVPAAVAAVGGGAAAAGDSATLGEARPRYGAPAAAPPAAVAEHGFPPRSGGAAPSSLPVPSGTSFPSGAPGSSGPAVRRGPEEQLPLTARPPGGGAGLAEHRARLRQALDLYAPARADEVATPGGAEPSAGPAPAEETGAPAPAALADEGTARLRLSERPYLGQLLGTYLLCEGDGELLLIDQHAAHERVVYERLRRAHAGAPLATQRLLFPASIELDARRSALVHEHADALLRLGFEVQPAANPLAAAPPGAARIYSLLGAPDLGAYGRGAQVHRDPERLFRHVLDELDDGGRSDSLRERSELLLATMACHSAVRAGDALDASKALALLQAMDEVGYSPYCPHGRPVLVRLSRGEIERRFGRA